ncbi:hypothetical protein WA026_001329 [Henosepilachna vigintioctopunctata]|uniref:Importin N-terminal domain-containing protein n=1 Tax=Henosepilachna vigintioctopunctata TaxID=420089 RepID=A0AAW1UKU5_9CUCU
MKMDENGSLVTLEQLMEEFFNQSTSNFRKHEIEQQLNAFKSSPHSWKLCLYFITHTSSQYVVMFSLSMLETVIKQHWQNGDLNYKEQLRHVLYKYLIENGNQAPHFLREKYAKLLVDIAREDWPHLYPTFMDNILELLKTESNLLIGLILLRTTSEEFMSTNNDIDKNRKEEIARLLHPYIPVVFQILTSILENLGNKPRHSATATPPPSPTHPSMAVGPSIQQLTSVTSYRPDSRALSREILGTLQHLFTWVPITEIPSHIIKCIFNLTNISSYAQEDDDMCVMAMSAINELLYRKCTPPGTEEFFVQLYLHMVDLLKDLSTSTIFRMDSIDSTFMEKLSELSVLLIQQHFWRLEMEPNVSSLEFLSWFFQLTVQLPSIQCYSQCLVVWIAFVKQIKPQNSHKYSEALLGLVSMLLKKIQYTSNFDQLREINTQEVNEDNDTEWSTLVKNTNEIIATIAEFAPLDTFNLVLLPWKTHYENYRSVTKEIAAPNSNFANTLRCDMSERDRLCCMLMDFSSLTQSLARLSSLFTDQDNTEVQNSCDDLIYCLFQRILDSAYVAAETKLYNCRLDAKLIECSNNVHSELLAALQTWFLWVLQRKKLTDLNLKTMIEITVPLLTEPGSTPPSVACSAARLLLTLTAQISPPTMMRIQTMTEFINAASTMGQATVETRHLVNVSICNLLLRNWGESTHRDLEMRQYLVGVFFDNITKDFRILTSTTEEQRVREVCDNTLNALSHIIDFCKHFSNSSKKLLYLALKNAIDHALAVFPAYVKYSEVSQNILVLFVNVLGVLQQQLGMEGTKQAVNVFLQVAVNEQHVVTAPSNIEKLLQVLKLVVEAPSSAYKNFLPPILELCMQNLCPVVLSQADEYPEVYLSLLNLFHSILKHRWQYFYISQVRSGFSPCVEADAASDFPQKPQELISILEIFGQALLQQDINIFKFSIGVLEDLNAKWNLYSKAIFREYLRNKFLTVLLSTLVEKSHCLLSEDTQVTIYNMASVNFQDFFTTFLPEFIRNFDGISPEQGQILMKNFFQNYDKDMPTFIQNLRIFVKDGQHLRMCNSKPRF